MFEHGASIFDREPGRQTNVESAKDRKIEPLEAIVSQKELMRAQKNEVISELIEENVLAKKASGEL